MVICASVGYPVGAQTIDLLPRGNEQPSFDCSTAKTASARLICADLELTRLDRALGATFQEQKARVYPPDQPRFDADELAWIRERNRRCDLVGKGDAALETLAKSKPCLLSAIQERIDLLADRGRNAASDPNKENSSRISTPSAAQSTSPQTTWPDPQQVMRMHPIQNLPIQPPNSEASVSSRFDIAKQQGYRPITFEDFKLDAKQLSETKAKLILHGFYGKSGTIDILQPTGLAVATARQYGNSLGVPLLTDEATRDIRKFFLTCIVQVGGEAVCIPATEIHRIGQASENFRKIVALFDFSLLAQSQQSTACQALHQVEGRAARWLLQCGKRLGSNDIRLTQEFFSQMLGCSGRLLTWWRNRFKMPGLFRSAGVEFPFWTWMASMRCLAIATTELSVATRNCSVLSTNFV
jgi:uncharacterized protein YecT (DUF1311 family)